MGVGFAVSFGVARRDEAWQRRRVDGQEEGSRIVGGKRFVVRACNRIIIELEGGLI